MYDGEYLNEVSLKSLQNCTRSSGHKLFRPIFAKSKGHNSMTNWSGQKVCIAQENSTDQQSQWTSIWGENRGSAILDVFPKVHDSTMTKLTLAKICFEQILFMVIMRMKFHWNPFKTVGIYTTNLLQTDRQTDRQTVGPTDKLNDQPPGWFQYTPEKISGI